MTDERDEIRRRADIVGLVSQRVRLKKSGKNYLGLCPFHQDKTPSFSVNSDTGRFRCFACGEKGDIFDWVMKTEGLDFVEALKKLALETGVTLSTRSGDRTAKSDRERWLTAMNAAQEFFSQELFRAKHVLAYCESRGLDADTIKKWGLGYAPDIGDALAQKLSKLGLSLAECQSLFLVDRDVSGGYYDKFRGRLMFPIRDDRRDLVGYGGRILGDGTPKYINSGDTPLYRKSRVLYGFDQARETLLKNRHAVLAEGYLDVIACHRAGVVTAMASLGTSLTEDQAKLLKRFCDRVTIFYDGDAAGEKAATRAVEILRAESLDVDVAMLPPGDDPDTLLKSRGAEALKQAVAGGVGPVDFELQSLARRLGTDSREFWEELPRVLVKEPNEVEAERLMLVYAGQHPTLRDSVAALRAMKRQYANERRAKSGGGTGLNRSRAIDQAAILARQLDLSSGERVFFKGVLNGPLRPRLWKFLRQSDLFETRIGSTIAQSLLDAFQDQPPTGRPVDWLGSLGDTEASDQLELLADLPDDQPLTEKLLTETIEHLLKRSETRKQRLQRSELGDSDEALRQIQEKLRQLNQ